MEEIIERIESIQDELGDIAFELMDDVQEPKKSICEIWKDNFLNFIKKNVKLL